MKRLLPLLAFVLSAFAAAVSCPAQSATAASTVYLQFTGSQVGEIRGEVVEKGREGWHQVLAFSHEIISPRDAASGQATGKRQHQPFKVVKKINRGTPQLFQALVQNVVLPKVVISIWTSNSRTGVEERLLTYTLGNAFLASVRPWMPNKSDPAAAGYPPSEELSFVYQSIEVTYPAEGIIAVDDWLSPASTP